MKGALSANRDGVPMRMSLVAKEYALCDFSMFEEDAPFMGDDASGEEILAKMFAEAEKHPASEEYSVSCDAEFVRVGDRCEIRYNECLDGETTQLTIITFDESVPGLVTVYKSGMATVTMTIEAGQRHSCIYRTPFMDFEMRLRATRVENSVSEAGGRILMDYALEIRGAVCHRTVMEIVVEPVE